MLQRRVHRLALMVLIFALGLSSVRSYAATTVDFWHFLAAGSELTALNEIVEQFQEEHPDIRIEMQYFPWGNPYYEKLITSVVGGSPPDVAMLHQTKIAEFVEAGVLAELTPAELRASGIRDEDYFPIPWQASQYQGKQYALPFDIHPIGLYINPRLVGEAGLPSTVPTTGQELFEAAKRINRDVSGDGVLDTIGFGIRRDGFTYYRLWYSIISQMGANLLNASQTRLSDDPRLAGALDLLIEARDTQALTIGVGAGDFLNQKAAFLVEGTWDSGGLARQGMEFDAAPLPAFGNTQAVWTDSHLVVLPRQLRTDEAQLAASKEFAKWITHNNYLWAKLGGHVPPSRRTLQSMDFKTLKHQVEFAKMLHHVVYFPQVQGAWEIQNSIANNLGGAMQQEVAPTQAFERLGTEIAAVLSGVGKK